MIELKNIVKTFDGNNNVVDNLDLKIHNGELMVLIGESGCGKTTSMKMINRTYFRYYRNRWTRYQKYG